MDRVSQPMSDFAGQGEAVSISVRSGSMSISRQRPAGAFNIFEGTIEKIIYLGDMFDYEVRVKDTLLRAQGDPDERFEVGQQVYLSFGEGASGVCCFMAC